LATSVRTLLKFVIGLFAAATGATLSSGAEEVRPGASSPAETLTMSAFIARIRQDAALRARFAQSPRAVLREFGIDPPPINLPERLSDAQIRRLLNDWTAGVDPPASSPDSSRLAPTPAPVVYGPPPGRPPEPPRRQ
jgi:hypothetical protein